MSLYCHECGSTDLRSAHLQWRDWYQLLALKYPIRCRACKTRYYGPIHRALQLPRPQHPRIRDKNVF
jgi:hypothetical protein